MSRGLATANATAATAAHVRPLCFVELRFDSATMYLHNGIGSYTWGSQTWLGLGALASISPVEESDELSPYRVTYSLSAIDADILAEALAQTLFERLAILYIGFVDDNGALVDTPHEFRRDYMDTMEVSVGGEIDVVTLHCESEHIRDTQAPGGMFNDEDQQTLYSGDTGFQYLPQLQDAQVFWGPGAPIGSRVWFGDRPPIGRGQTPPRVTGGSR